MKIINQHFNFVNRDGINYMVKITSQPYFFYC